MSISTTRRAICWTAFLVDQPGERLRCLSDSSCWLYLVHRVVVMG